VHPDKNQDDADRAQKAFEGICDFTCSCITLSMLGSNCSVVLDQEKNVIVLSSGHEEAVNFSKQLVKQNVAV
jgi:hypothetical protein